MVYRVACLSDQKQMGICWTLYASDWQGRVVNGCTNYYGTASPTDPGYQFHRASIPWVYGNDSPSLTETERLNNIRTGALYQYVGDVKIYKCARSEKGVLRSYSMLDGMNSIWWMTGTDNILVKRVEQIKQPALRGLFIDEGSDGSVSTMGWCINYIVPAWWDKPPLRHLNGTTLSFADGHSEYRVWEDKRTIDYIQGRSSVKMQATNEDLHYMVRITWGKLGYNPADYAGYD